MPFQTFTSLPFLPMFTCYIYILYYGNIFIYTYLYMGQPLNRSGARTMVSTCSCGYQPFSEEMTWRHMKQPISKKGSTLLKITENTFYVSPTKPQNFRAHLSKACAGKTLICHIGEFAYSFPLPFIHCILGEVIHIQIIK